VFLFIDTYVYVTNYVDIRRYLHSRTSRCMRPVLSSIIKSFRNITYNKLLQTSVSLVAEILRRQRTSKNPYPKMKESGGVWYTSCRQCVQKHPQSVENGNTLFSGSRLKWIAISFKDAINTVGSVSD